MIHETLLKGLLQYATEHPQQAAAIVMGTIAAAANYAKTGKLPLGRLPYRAMRAAWRQYSDRWFGTARPKSVAALVIDADHDAIEAALRPRHFETGDLSSMEYADEVLNLRRPRGWMANPQTGKDVPMETHVRTFTLDDGRVLALTHDEANRYEATSEHLSPGLYSWERGRDILAEDLEDAGIAYERIASERAAGVTVLRN